MHAIICQGNGKYYVSAVFGHYRDTRSFRKFNDSYWIVWDEDKKRLIRWSAYVPHTRYLIKQILIIDANRDDWHMDEDGVGCVDFLSREMLDSFLDDKHQPEDILDRCREADAGFTYTEIREIRTEKDIEDLGWATGGFHDARIIKEELHDDGTLYLRFDGTWGCEIEVWFNGDLEYDTSSRDPEYYDPYWFGATILLQDGFVYLIDDGDMTPEDITEGYCYFKARSMRYRIIPD